MADSNTSISESAIIYKDVRIHQCSIADHCIVGDDSDLVNVEMDEYSELGRRNLVRKTVIGKGSYTGTNAIIKNTRIGKYCSLAWNISIGGRSHDYSSVSTYTPWWWKKVFGVDVEETRINMENCVIGNDVWIGAGANIVSGVTVGDGAVIGAGAVVVKDVEPYAIVTGVPAKTIKHRFPSEVISGLEELKWWDWPSQKIAHFAPLLNAADFDKDKLAVLCQKSMNYDKEHGST